MDKLLKLLSENSGFTTAEIAAMLGEPEDYIKAQIKEYENSGVIKGYQAVGLLCSNCCFRRRRISKWIVREQN